MKKWVILILCLFSFLPQLRAEEGIRAKQVLGWVISGRGDSLAAAFHPDLRTNLSAADMSALCVLQWKQLEKRLGCLCQQSAMQRVFDDSLKMDQCYLDFKNGKALFSLLTDKQHHVVGYNLSLITVPQGEKDSITASHLYIEEDTMICNGRIQLPATYCRPVGNQSHPIVVIVHGSGPTDRNGTIGANHPYRDVAHWLASYGIATLRYDKRTFIYGVRSNEIGGPLNYDTEVVDDAVKALEIASHLPGVDSKRVFLLGHSLGGMLAPRILAASKTPVAGMIACAAPARSLRELMRSQFRFMAQLQGGTNEKAESLADLIYMKMPTTYRSLAEAYNPVAEARSKHLPMLFLQGGLDFMVTGKDFNLWKQGLGSRKDVSFVWIPNCDHLLREQTKMATPEAYVRAGRLSALAIHAVVAFVSER